MHSPICFNLCLHTQRTQSLNPSAVTVSCSWGKVPLDIVLGMYIYIKTIGLFCILKLQVSVTYSLQPPHTEYSRDCARYVYIYKCKYTYIYVCTHICIRACKHVLLCTHMYTHVYINIYIRICVYIHDYIYICAYIYMYTYIHTYTHTHIYIYICMYVRACVYVYMYAYICVFRVNPKPTARVPAEKAM